MRHAIVAELDIETGKRRCGPRIASIAELDVDAGKRRCGPRTASIAELDVDAGKQHLRPRNAKRETQHEPDDAKGRESTASRHGVIKC
jgi:hypothetical protein